MPTDARMTPGLTRALQKGTHLGVCSCGFPMPKYPGRYPSKCPMCKAPRRAPDMINAPEEGALTRQEVARFGDPASKKRLKKAAK